MRYPEITACVFNYNGFREPILKGKGRIRTTIESLLETIPEFSQMNVLFIDNESTDGSNKYLEGLGFGEVVTIPRVIKETSWQATTRNNMYNLGEVVKIVSSPYMWRIEDDSYFYNSQGFLQKAIDVFECDDKIDIIHLRRWTSMDAKDMPGVGRNLNRISDKRISKRGYPYFVIEKLESNAVWVPVGDDLGDNFVPDKDAGYGMCPYGESQVGSIRINEKGEYERLLTEKWATYTNHGWICRTNNLQLAFNTFIPQKEGDLADYFKKHYRAAKLDQDAFVAFGWRTRHSNWTQEEALQVFEYVKRNNVPSCNEYDVKN